MEEFQKFLDSHELTATGISNRAFVVVTLERIPNTFANPQKYHNYSFLLLRRIHDIKSKAEQWVTSKDVRKLG